MWRMLMLEECRPRLFGNSDSVTLGSQSGRRGGGGTAPDSAGEKVVPVDRSWAAAAHGGVMQRCLDMSRIMEMSASSLAQPAPFFPAMAGLIGRVEKKVTKQSHREIRNMRPDDDLSQNRSERAWETKP
jgi:hypothetical protein